MKTIRYIGLFLILTLGGVLVVLNLQPYMQMARWLIEVIAYIPLINILTIIPIVSGIVALISRVIADVFGIALWGIIQLAEILPHWIKGDLDVLNSLIRGIEAIAPQAIKNGDTETVAKLKQDYNQAPKKWLSTAGTIASVAYVVDFALCALRFPPYKGGFQTFWEDIQIGVSSLDNVDWANLGNLLATMLGFEMVILFAVWLARGLRYFAARKPQTYYYEAPGTTDAPREEQPTQGVRRKVRRV